MRKAIGRFIVCAFKIELDKNLEKRLRLYHFWHTEINQTYKADNSTIETRRNNEYALAVHWTEFQFKQQSLYFVPNIIKQVERQLQQWVEEQGDGNK